MAATDKTGMSGYCTSNWSQAWGVGVPRSVTNGVNEGLKHQQLETPQIWGTSLWALQNMSPEWQLQQVTGISAFGHNHCESDSRGIKQCLQLQQVPVACQWGGNAVL